MGGVFQFLMLVSPSSAVILIASHIYSFCFISLNVNKIDIEIHAISWLSCNVIPSEDTEHKWHI